MPDQKPATLLSPYSAALKRPEGKAFRTGLIGEAIDVIYKSIDTVLVLVGGQVLRHGTRVFNTSVLDLGDMIGDTDITFDSITGGYIRGNANGSDRALNLDSATDLATSIAGYNTALGGEVYTAPLLIEFSVMNNSTGANSLTVTPGTDGSIIGAAGNFVLAQNEFGKFLLEITDLSTPAYVVHRVG